MTEHSFSLQELAEYAGPMWIEGDHEGEHAAGRDLTAAMTDAPHGAENFVDFPVVGVLAD